MMDVDAILGNPAFRTLEPERAAWLRGLMLRLDGRGTAEAMVVIAEAMKKMPKGRALDRVEQNAMMEAVLEGLPPADRNRFKTILKMLGMG